MNRALLVLAVLALPVDAAPQLRLKSPAPGNEEARIEALRAKYDQIRKAGPAQLAEQVEFSQAEAKLRVILPELDNIDRLPHTSSVPHEWMQMRHRQIRANPTLSDLYDIAVYDRKKAAAGK